MINSVSQYYIVNIVFNFFQCFTRARIKKFFILAILFASISKIKVGIPKVYADESGINRMSFFLLSKRMLNFVKMPFRPRINGVFSLLENAHVISMGLPVIFMVILAMYVTTLRPSIPQKLILGAVEMSMSRSPARCLGKTVQSAPVSTKKSNFWNPYLVRIGIAIIGSAIIPSWVCLWPRGKSKGIDVYDIVTGDEANGQVGSVKAFLRDFFAKLGVGLRVGQDIIIFTSNVFSPIFLLQSCIRNCFHILTSRAKCSMGSIACQGNR